MEVTVIRPPAPPVISAPGQSADGTFAIRWSPVAFAVSYTVHESKDGGNWSHVHSTLSTEAIRRGMGFGTYRYLVRGCNEAGCGTYSNVVQIRSIPPPPTPAISKSLQTRWTCAGKVKLACQIEWGGVLGASRYEVRSTPDRVVYSGPDIKVVAAHSSIYCAQTHVIRACDESGCSPDSAPYPQALLDLGEVGRPTRTAPGDASRPALPLIEHPAPAAWPSCPAG